MGTEHVSNRAKIYATRLNSFQCHIVSLHCFLCDTFFPPQLCRTQPGFLERIEEGPGKVRKRTTLKPQLWGCGMALKPWKIEHLFIHSFIHSANNLNNYWTTRQSLRWIASKAAAKWSTSNFLKSNSNLCFQLLRTIIGKMIHKPSNNFQKHFWHVPIFFFSWLLWSLSQQKQNSGVAFSVSSILAYTHPPGLFIV